MQQKIHTRQIGVHYERLAGSYLEKQDIIAENGTYLIFCEVKYRKGTDITPSLEAVDIRKQQRISRAALFYMSRHHLAEIPCRFDVIGISDTQIQHIKDAFYYVGG